MSDKNVAHLGVVVFFIAWCFDQLFWGKSLGISFSLFICILLSGWLFLSRLERLRPAAHSLVLGFPAIVSSVLVFLRQEPLTQFLAVLLTFACLGLLSMSWLGGRWLEYTLRDTVVQSLRLGLSLFEKPMQTWLDKRRNLPVNPVGDPGQAPSIVSGRVGNTLGRAKLFASLSFGILLAFPLVLFLAGLLASADLIFAEKLNALLVFLRWDKLLEYTLRLFLISLGAYLLSGVYLHSFTASQDENMYADQPPWPKPFLGWVEAITILGCVVALFAFFVAIQLRYFFGGQVNIHLYGFTYAEYARRGFFELLMVAWVSLLVVLLLSTITVRGDKRSRSIFSGFISAVVGLVGVILISAFQRLLLYESAYGFTRLRTYTHVFMVWLGILLLVLAILEFSGRLRHFALAAFLAFLGFGLTVGVLNVDRFIVQQNVRRALAGGEFDPAYLASLSDDAVIGLFEFYLHPDIPQPVRDQIGGALVCHRILVGRKESSAQPAQQPWMTFHWSRHQAASFYSRHEEQLAHYPVMETKNGIKIDIESQPLVCEPAW